MTMPTQVYAQTLARLLADTVGPLPVVTVPLQEAIGRRLAGDLVTVHPSPRFKNSQMDGYGIAYANLAGGRFRVGPDIPAGQNPAEIYHYGVNGYGHDTAVPIMTGALIPEDVVAVIPVEHADPAAFVAIGDYVDLPAVEAGKNIRPAGSDMPAGTLLAAAGTQVDAILVAAAASQGISEVPVTAAPRIAVIAGGAEIIIGGQPRDAQIFDANTPLLQGLATTHGLHIVGVGHTTDELPTFRSTLDRLIRDYRPDVIVTSGGISAGKYEVVRQFLEQLSVSWVGKLDQQPGGPQGYGVYQGVPIIALPGNPISTLVSMRMLVLPALWAAFQTGWRPQTVDAVMAAEVTGIPGKTQYRRAVIGRRGSQLVAQLHGETSSHLLAQAVGANALLEIPPLARFRPGQQVTAHLMANADFTAAPPPSHAAGHTASHTAQPVPGPAQRGKTAQVVIASTRAAAGIYDDEVGPVLVQWLREQGFATPAPLVVADQDIASTLRAVLFEDEAVPDVVITSGGTGISPTDHTVDVVQDLLDAQLPHVATAMLLEGLKHTPRAALSRGVAGIVGRTFLVTLPGSSGGVRDGMTALDPLLGHIVEQLKGEDHRR